MLRVQTLCDYGIVAFQGSLRFKRISQRVVIIGYCASCAFDWSMRSPVAVAKALNRRGPDVARGLLGAACPVSAAATPEHMGCPWSRGAHEGRKLGQSGRVCSQSHPKRLP